MKFEILDSLRSPIGYNRHSEYLVSWHFCYPITRFVIALFDACSSRAITRDSNTYHHAEEFIPERFEEKLDLLDPRAYAFGFGRR